ncbi:unnamed protein product [Rhizophagus irregularis]|nr:unnamed protein product [Rhizophagus irregularis]
MHPDTIQYYENIIARLKVRRENKDSGEFVNENDEKKLQESESHITTPTTKNNQSQYRIILPCSPLQQLFLDQKHYFHHP